MYNNVDKSTGKFGVKFAFSRVARRTFYVCFVVLVYKTIKHCDKTAKTILAVHAAVKPVENLRWLQ